MIIEENTSSRIDKLKPVIYFICIVIIIYSLYKIYQYLNVNYRVTQIIPYDKSLKWDKVPDCWYEDKYNDAIVADFFVSSSSNSSCVGNLKYDYLNLDVIRKVLMAGARFLDFTVMVNDLSDHPTPVVSRGFKEGQWQTSLNNLPFEEVCYTVKKFAFQSYYDKNQKLTENNYPLFIYLDIKTDNLNALDDIGNIIEKMWGNRLPGKEYQYKFNDLAHVHICKLFGKIIIMTNNVLNLEGSKLDNYIHYNKLKKLHYNELSSYNLKENAKVNGIDVNESDNSIINPDRIDVTKLTLDPKNIGKDIITSPDYLTKYCKNNLVLIYPSAPNDIQLTNHEFSLAMSYGCQFVSMNFQAFDDHVTKYLDIFKTSPFKLKNASLRLNRSKIKKPVKIDDIEDSFEDNLIMGADLLFRNHGIAIIPFYTDNIYMQFIPTTRKIISNQLSAFSNKNKYNPYNFKEIDLYRIVPGIENIKNTISFKSVRYPKQYLTIQQNDIKLMPNEHTTVFGKSASFYMLFASAEMEENNDIKYYNFVPVVDKTKYIRILNDELIVDKYDGQNDFLDQIKFSFRQVPIGTYYTFKDYKGRYLRILDGGFLTSNAQSLSTDTKFILNKLENNYYSIKASNNKYFTYNDVRTVSATAYGIAGDHERFEIVKQGQLYKIVTYFSSKRKTIIVMPDGGIKVEYDGNLLKPEVTDDKGNIISEAVYASKLGRRKYFYLVQSYGIKRKADDDDF
jgi:hypothetical protein